MGIFLLNFVVEAYRFFCMLVAQRYVGPENSEDSEYKVFLKNPQGQLHFDRNAMKNLSEDSRQEIVSRIQEAHEKVFESMQCIPSQLFLVFR